MAAGLPVIASDFPLWREIVEEAGCGLLVDPKDPQAIADAMQWILDHPEEAAEMGRRGRAAVEARYNWEAESAKLVSLYRRLLSDT
jgi:glycosyltransferase involved in cell wall biosynthesis